MNILKKLLKAYKNLQIHWYIWYLKYSENGCTMIKCIKMRLELWLVILFRVTSPFVGQNCPASNRRNSFGFFNGATRLGEKSKD